jgi:putative N6-adenine-specific DNA methylase
VAAARSNLENAVEIAAGQKRSTPLSKEAMPSFEILRIEEAAPHLSAEKGFIVTNPPYGRRLGDTESAEKTYSEMGKSLKPFSGWKLALISDHDGFESFFGRKADSCREITNGAIRSYLYLYEKLP